MNTFEYNRTVHQYSDRLYRYALKLTRDAESSKDLVQESFLKLWMNKDKVKGDHIKPFLFRVLYNKMIDDKRKMGRIQHVDVIPEKSGTKNVFGEDRDIIDKAFAQLEDKQRAIIMLRDWDGYSYDEIAKILNISLSNVKVNLFRARKKMKSVINALEHNHKKESYENK